MQVLPNITPGLTLYCVVVTPRKRDRQFAVTRSFMLTAIIRQQSVWLLIDLLSKYLGTRVFDWPRGNFPLARSPLYRERSGKLEVFQRQRLETGGRQLKTCPCRTDLVAGFRQNLCTLFDCSPVPFFSIFSTGRSSLCCGESLSKGRSDLALGFHASFEILLDKESMRLWFFLR